MRFVHSLPSLEKYFGEMNEGMNHSIRFSLFLSHSSFVISYFPMSTSCSLLEKETKLYLHCHQVLYQLSQHNYGSDMMNCQREAVYLFTTKFVDPMNAKAAH